MEIIAPPDTEAPDQNSDEPALAYVLSSMYGFGHSSRAIAVAQALNPARPITFIARGAPSHEFLENNLRGYEAPLGFVEHVSEVPLTDEEYTSQNRHLVEVFAGARAVVNDFDPHIAGLRFLLAQSGVDAPLAGIYHSVTGYTSDDEAITRFRDEFMEGAEGFDHLFLIEPRPHHEPPYALDSGTRVMHIDPIVRRPDLTAEEVKPR